MSEPNFELLPDDPLAFFELEEAFSTRDLKRRYTRLIKRYKPDRDPEAFKQIRAAYEDLLPQADAEARQPSAAESGVPSRTEARASAAEGPEPLGPEPLESKSSGEESSGEEPSEEETKEAKPRVQALLSQLERQGIARTYELLVSKQPKRPADYQHLALLADLEPEGRRGFLDWILAGLREHPDDEGLQSTLGALCRDGLPDEAIGEGLERIAGTLSPGRFYALSGPLWLVLLRRRSFREVREHWDRCEEVTRGRGLSDPAAPLRLRLLVRILRAACWRADEAWLRETSEFISRHHTRLPDDAQSELDFVELIREYLMQTNRRVHHSPTRTRLDRILRAYCELPETPFDEVLFLELGALREEGWELLNEFSEEDPAGGVTVSALEWVSGEAEARRLQSPPPVSEEQLIGSLRRLEWGYASDGRWRWLSYFPVVGRALVQSLGYLPALGLVVGAYLRKDLSLLVVAAVLAVAFRALDQRRQLVRRGQKRILQVTASLLERLQAKLYATKLRPGIGEYLLRTRIPARVLANEIARQGERDEWSWDADWLADLIREDTGLTAMCLARRFERP